MTVTPRRPVLEPAGFPIEPETRLGEVTGPAGNRTIAWESDLTALAYSRDDQPSGDPNVANSGGWNCRLHLEYEARPAVDWYIPEGTPVRATLDGNATLYVITTSNAFETYGVEREPYLGNPDRARAPLSPFPGPGGGKGVFVEVANEAFVAECAHLDLRPTLEVVPPGAYLVGFSAGFDFAGTFSAMRAFDNVTPVARWQVHAGDVVGYSGDTGYSEAPHLHYTVRRAGGGLLCPTTEAGFSDGGWLFR
jgi:hypothetical protein